MISSLQQQHHQTHDLIILIVYIVTVALPATGSAAAAAPAAAPQSSAAASPPPSAAAAAAAASMEVGAVGKGGGEEGCRLGRAPGGQGRAAGSERGLKCWNICIYIYIYMDSCYYVFLCNPGWQQVKVLHPIYICIYI